MAEPTKTSNAELVILMTLTAATGIIDAVSYLAMGHVFAANMTGNIVFLGFALGEATGVSISKSVLALLCFAAGAVIGGRMTLPGDTAPPERKAIRAFAVEAVLLLVAATLSIGLSTTYDGALSKVGWVVGVLAVAMGMQNAIVRKLGIADVTTTVLTMTITGIAADSGLAGGNNPRWRRRLTAIFVMTIGAAAGVLMLRNSVALPLYAVGAIVLACVLIWMRIEAKKAPRILEPASRI